MNAVASLVAVLDRAQGSRLVLHAGDRPHVWVNSQRHDISAEEMSATAVKLLCDRILSKAGLDTLAVSGHTAEPLSGDNGRGLVATAELTGGDNICLEIRREAAPENDTPRNDTPRNDTPPNDTPRNDTPRNDTPRNDTHTEIDDLMTRAALRNASALYVRVGEPVRIRVHDKIELLGPQPAAESVVSYFAGGAAAANGWQQLVPDLWQKDDADLGALHCRKLSDDHGLGLVIHLRALGTSALLRRQIPRSIRHICEAEDGLLVVWGPTTRATCAAAATVAEWSAEQRRGFVISINGEIRVGQPIDGAFVSQRRSSDTDLGAIAEITRAADERPDILVVAPLRRAASKALLAACTANRLVIVAVVAHNPVDAIAALLGDGASPDAQKSLAVALRGMLSWRSLRRLGGGRINITDVLIPSSELRTSLAKNGFDAVKSRLRPQPRDSRSGDHALARAVIRGAISLRQAAAHSPDPSGLVQLLRSQRRTLRLRRDAAGG